jgi:hypothetical protein
LCLPDAAAGGDARCDCGEFQVQPERSHHPGRGHVEGFHDVTEDNFSWASETGEAGWVYQRVFTAAGEVLYHCTLHSGPGQPIQTSMNGRIAVEAPAENPLFADGFE